MPTVLVVEDDLDFRELERLVLQSNGYTVLTAGNGMEALALLEHQHPCAIVLDLMMPVMDGLTFLDRRGDVGDGRSVPVICVSAAGHDLTAEALRRGAVTCFAKPTDVDELCERINELCGR